jgi:hypothetical protein
MIHPVEHDHEYFRQTLNVKVILDTHVFHITKPVIYEK